MPEPRIGFIAGVVREDHLRANAWRLCSLQLCCFNQFRISAKFAGNFAMKWRSRGRGFKSALLHISVSRVSDIAENRSKSARVRAICDSADPETASLHRQSRKSANFSLGAICLCPRIITIDSPEDDFALSLYSLDLRSVRAEHRRNVASVQMAHCGPSRTSRGADVDARRRCANQRQGYRQRFY